MYITPKRATNLIRNVKDKIKAKNKKLFAAIKKHSFPLEDKINAYDVLEKFDILNNEESEKKDLKIAMNYKQKSLDNEEISLERLSQFHDKFVEINDFNESKLFENDPVDDFFLKHKGVYKKSVEEKHKLQKEKENTDKKLVEVKKAESIENNDIIEEKQIPTTLDSPTSSKKGQLFSSEEEEQQSEYNNDDNFIDYYDNNDNNNNEYIEDSPPITPPQEPSYEILSFIASKLKVSNSIKLKLFQTMLSKHLQKDIRITNRLLKEVIDDIEENEFVTDKKETK